MDYRLNFTIIKCNDNPKIKVRKNDIEILSNIQSQIKEIIAHLDEDNNQKELDYNDYGIFLNLQHCLFNINQKCNSTENLLNKYLDNEM